MKHESALVHPAVPSSSGPQAAPLVQEQGESNRSELPARHTPGPWKVKRDGLHVSIETSKYSSIECYAGTMANARLIAAAPDLLAALQETHKLLAMSIFHNSACVEQARAAIERATS